MPTESPSAPLISIDDLVQEGIQPLRRNQPALPKDDWWFPDYVPAWARLLPRDLYSAAHDMCGEGWKIDRIIRLEPKRKKGRPRKESEGESTKALGKVGRPPMGTPEERIQFVRLVNAFKAILKHGKQRAGDAAALELILDSKDVESTRIRVIRDRKRYKITW